MKKLISLLLALTMVLSLSVVAFAADPVGSITINGVSADTEYAVYRLLDLESYNKTSGAYSYKANSAWATFISANAAGEAPFFEIDAADYVTWKGSEDDARVAQFAKDALEYAKANGIAPVKASHALNSETGKVVATGDFVITGNTGVFAELPLGWYLVDSNAGALCGLTTTDPDASINAKNKIPTIDKQVQEDLTGMWGDVNTADIGQIVNYMSIIHVAAGAEDYVLHDKMSEGLTFVHAPTADDKTTRGVTKIVHVDSLGKETILTEGTHYTIKWHDVLEEGEDAEDLAPAPEDTTCTFEVVFNSTYVAALKPNDRLIVYYNAMLNRHAEVGSTTGNSNESWLEYGEDHFTTHDTTTTYTFSIDIVKTDSSNKLLDGAKFKVYDAATGGNEIAVVPLLKSDDVTPMLDAKGNPMYRRARADETGVEIEVKGGKVTVVGFDNGVYYLEETVAPAGFNKLTARKEFTIADANLDATFNDGIYSSGSGVHVVNKTGSMLPETGAAGTAAFIAFGTFTVLGTGVLLVTKKRMSMIEE